MQVFRRLVMLVFAFALSACAISMAGRDEFLKVSSQHGSEDSTLKIHMACPGKLYSIMGSVLIPLPPVIPNFIGNDKISNLFITAQKKDKIKIEFIDAAGSKILTPISIREERDNFQDSLKVDYFFSYEIECEELNGQILRIVVGNKAWTYSIKYSEGSIKLSWAYLSA